MGNATSRQHANCTVIIATCHRLMRISRGLTLQKVVNSWMNTIAGRR